MYDMYGMYGMFGMYGMYGMHGMYGMYGMNQNIWIIAHIADISNTSPCGSLSATQSGPATTLDRPARGLDFVILFLTSKLGFRRTSSHI